MRPYAPDASETFRSGTFPPRAVDRAYPNGTSARRVAVQQHPERAVAVGVATGPGAPVRLIENDADVDAAAELVATLEGFGTAAE